jgi:IstB-like ATP binding protein
MTSNLAFSEWSRVFVDEKLTAALLDRLAQHADVLVTRGPAVAVERLAMRREEAIRLVDVRACDGLGEVAKEVILEPEEYHRAVVTTRDSKYEYMFSTSGGYWTQWLAL